MAILYDARGNEIKGAMPDPVTNETVTDARTITATLASVNAEAIMDLNGIASVSIDIRTGAGALTFVFEGSIDGTNYFTIPAFAQQQLIAATITQESYVSSVVVATTTSGLYTVGTTGLRRIRVRVSAYTSGNIVVALRGSIADFAIVAKQMPSNLHVTITAAAGTGPTATLPLATGLFHYITKIHLVQFVAVARTAAATPVLATTSNLPGSPIYSLDATAGAVGQIFQYDFSPITPLKSSVAGTATTFVTPNTASTIFRWNISYYVGA